MYSLKFSDIKEKSLTLRQLFFFLSFSEQAELKRLNKTPAVAPVLQNPNYLQVDPFPLLNVPQHQTKTNMSLDKFGQDQVARRSPTPNKSISFEDPPTTLIIIPPTRPPTSPCPSDEGCENGE